MKALKWILIVTVSAFVALLVIGANTEVDSISMAEDLTEKALKNRMKDPNSMLIRSSYVVQSKSAHGTSYLNVCGIVDGKNSYGGYTGGVRFVSQVERQSETRFRVVLVDIEDVRSTESSHKLGMLTGFETVYWNKYCVDETHPAITVDEL